MNRIVIVGLIILVLLIALTALLSSFIQNKSTSQNTNPTLIPTQVVDFRTSPKSSVHFQPTLSPTEQARRTAVTQALSARGNRYNYIQSLPQDKKDALDSFTKQKLPYQSDSFDMVYSPYLDQFFVDIKKPDGGQKFEDLLKQNNLLDLKAGNPNLFTLRNNVSVSTQLNGAETLIEGTATEVSKEDDTPSATETTAPENQALDTLVLGSKALLSFNFGAPKPKKTPVPAGKGSGQISSSAQQLLNNPRLRLSEGARADLASGRVAQVLIDLIGTLLQDHTLFIGYFFGGHSCGSGGTSNHCAGRAADIDGIDGDNALGPESAVAKQVTDYLINLEGGNSVFELGQPFYDGPVRNGVQVFSEDHRTPGNYHIHVGFDQ